MSKIAMTFEEADRIENALNSMRQADDLLTVSLSIFENGSIEDGGEVSPWALPYESVIDAALGQLRAAEQYIQEHVRNVEITKPQ